MAGVTHIEGFTQMRRALAKADKTVAKDLRTTLRKAAEPVRAEAVDRAVRDITNIGPTWSQMRTGVTQHEVYVAPRKRGRGRLRRPNLAGLLMDRAMQPALDAHEREIENEVGEMLDALVKRWAR